MPQQLGLATDHDHQNKPSHLHTYGLLFIKEQLQFNAGRVNIHILFLTQRYNLIMLRNVYYRRLDCYDKITL